MMRAVVIALGALASVAGAAEPQWERELRQFGYLFFHLSSINAVNGLNLTRGQAVQLQGLARYVEGAAAKPPSVTAPMRPELEPARRAWLEMRATLLRGDNPSKELRDRAGAGFRAKSTFVRATVRPLPAGRDTRCATCHQDPAAAAKGLGGHPMTVTPKLQQLVSRAHSEAAYGPKGLWRLLLVAKKVDAVLTDGQRAILSSFTCCIAPPEDLSNPMRAGQAESDGKEMAILRKVRACTDQEWPWVRAVILLYVSPVAEAVSPGATAMRKAGLRRLVAETLDRARAMNDTEFEVEKHKLVAGVQDALVPSSKESAMKTAYFLMMPGVADAYAACIRRLDAATDAH